MPAVEEHRRVVVPVEQDDGLLAQQQPERVDELKDEAKKLVCEDVYQELELAYRWRETQELEQARRDCKPIVGTVNLELCEIV